MQKKIGNNYSSYDFYKVVKSIIEFCQLDMGSLYCDVIKDRQYTTPEASFVRRSCQTTLWYLLQVLVLWSAPIIPFTAEESWSLIPRKKKPSIFLEEWLEETLFQNSKFN